jgi:hypothetical protein
MVDLFFIYKQYYNRWYYRQTNATYYEMKELAHLLVQQLYLNRFEKDKKEIAYQEALLIAAELIQMEREYRCYKIFGLNLLRALESKKYLVDVPYPVARRWSTIDVLGEVYIITAPSMNNICKLGATTLDINTRIKKYENRYGYRVELFYSIEIAAPFSFEKYISDMIKKNQVWTKSDEHTNEWYSISPDELQKTIEGNMGSFLTMIRGIG